MHIIFFSHFPILENFTQLKDPRRELGIFPSSHTWTFLKYQNKDHFGFNYFSSPKIFPIKIIWEEIIWLLQNKWNIGGKRLKSNIWFLSGVYCYFIWIWKKYAFFKNCIFRPKNVHYVLNILLRWRKLFLAFFRIFL